MTLHQLVPPVSSNSNFCSYFTQWWTLMWKANKPSSSSDFGHVNPRVLRMEFVKAILSTFQKIQEKKTLTSVSSTHKELFLECEFCSSQVYLIGVSTLQIIHYHGLLFICLDGKAWFCHMLLAHLVHLALVIRHFIHVTLLNTQSIYCLMLWIKLAIL